MQALINLIERKKKYLSQCTNERTIVALKAEINILINVCNELIEAENNQIQNEKLYWRERKKTHEFFLRVGFIFRILKINPIEYINCSSAQLKYMAELTEENEKLDQEINELKNKLQQLQYVK